MVQAHGGGYRPVFEGLGALLFSASLWALTTSPLLFTPPDPTVENHYEFVLTLKTIMNLFFWCPKINSRAEGQGRPCEE